MRSVNLKNLPKRGKTNQIDWKNSEGYKIYFDYDDISGEISIISYLGEDKIKVNYNGNISETYTYFFRKGKIKAIIERNLVDTHPEVAKLLTHKELGYNLTHGSEKIEEFECDKCGYITNKKVNTVVRNGFSCPKCSDGISYPEKFVISLLDQLDVIYEKQKIFKWSKNIVYNNKKLNGDKKYDFYIPTLNLMIETHGQQHYVRGFDYRGSKNLKEEQENDRLKEELAKENGISKYFVIDCRFSEIDWIKKSILESKLVNIFDFDNVDWLACHEFACSSLVKIACELWNKGIKNTNEISIIMNINKTTACRYLKKGAESGLCDYDAKEVLKRSREKTGKLLGEKISRKIIQLTLEGVFIKEWDSIRESLNAYGMRTNNVSAVCRGRRKSACGYKWMYKDNYNEYIRN